MWLQWSYIIVRGDIVTAAHNISTQVALKVCASFTKCTSKTDGKLIDDAKSLN